MARHCRIQHERDGMFYHVMTRTVQKAMLFEDPFIKEWIYRKILWLSSIYFVDLHAIAVMGNHYHIVLAVRKPALDPTELQKRFEALQRSRSYSKKWYEWRAKPWHAKLTNLSEFMKELNETVARYLNFKNQTRGHVWGDRFKSVLIEDGRGLLTCMAYVELNGVRAGLCAKPTDYRWCSVGRYHQGGPKEAGVSIPKLPGFENLKSQAQRQKGFALYVNYLAENAEGEQTQIPDEYKELAALVDRVDVGDIAKLVLRRTRWLSMSLILGSEGFCSEMIARFGLQPGRYHGPRPFDLGGALYNGRQRAGPFQR